MVWQCVLTIVLLQFLDFNRFYYLIENAAETVSKFVVRFFIK